MNRNIKKIILVALVLGLICASFACKSKPKHKWVEVGATESAETIKPGVHPERGSVSDAVKIILAPLTYPKGRNDKGVRVYDKYLFELQELTPENISDALAHIGLIDQESLFCDLVITDSDEEVNAGPGAMPGTKLNKKGVVRYVDLGSAIDNSDLYKDKVNPKDLVGLVDMEDILYCITETYKENFQLVSCDIEPITMEEYDEIHENE